MQTFLTIVTRTSLSSHVFAVRTGLTLVLITGVLLITQVAVPEFAEKLVSGEVFLFASHFESFQHARRFVFMQMHLHLEVTVASLVFSSGCGTRRQEALIFHLLKPNKIGELGNVLRPVSLCQASFMLSVLWEP